MLNSGWAFQSLLALDTSCSLLEPPSYPGLVINYGRSLATSSTKKNLKLITLYCLFPFPLQTPEKKVKDHFSTGHAESPATIVVGRAYSTTVRSAGRVPKVVKNPILKLNMDIDENFTGEILKSAAHSASCAVLSKHLLMSPNIISRSA